MSLVLTLNCERDFRYAGARTVYRFRSDLHSHSDHPNAELAEEVGERPQEEQPSISAKHGEHRCSSQELCRKHAPSFPSLKLGLLGVSATIPLQRRIHQLSHSF